MAIEVITHQQGWAVVDFHNGYVKTCLDTFHRDQILAGMAANGVPLTKIHVFEFTKHQRPRPHIDLDAPLKSWV